MADDIDDDFAAHDLPESWKTALRFTDHMLGSPGPLPAGLQADLDANFDPSQQLEMGLGLALFHGFSKMLIALGLEPHAMDTTVLPTPSPLGAGVTPADPADPHVALLASRPDLADRWADMVRQLRDLLGRDAAALDTAAARMAGLLGVDWATGPARHPDPQLDALATELAELFLIDVRAITPEHRAALHTTLGPRGPVALIMGLAVFDGIYRLAAVWPDGVAGATAGS